MSGESFNLHLVQIKDYLNPPGYSVVIVSCRDNLKEGIKHSLLKKVNKWISRQRNHRKLSRTGSTFNQLSSKLYSTITDGTVRQMNLSLCGVEDYGNFTNMF